MDNLPSNDIGEHIIDMLHLVHRKILKSDSSAGKIFSRQQYGLVSQIEACPHLSLSELCRQLTMTKPQMTVMLSRLADMGVVARTLDDSDRRVRRADLTEFGRAAIEKHREALRHDIKNNLAALNAEDYSSFSQAVQMIKNIGQKLA